jgi:hypothetical protein
MKIKNVPGEWGFRALVPAWRGYDLSQVFYLSLEDAKKDYPKTDIKWPVEVLENGAVYIPDPSELE